MSSGLPAFARWKAARVMMGGKLHFESSVSPSWDFYNVTTNK